MFSGLTIRTPRWASVLICSGMALLACAVQGASLGLSGSVQHVVHISFDGLGAVFLAQYLAEDPGGFPTFHRLVMEGASTFNARCDPHVSLTEPNHSTMFTGRPVVQQPTNVSFSAPHGFTANIDPGAPWTVHNFGNPAVPYKASVFDVVHDHGLTTAFFAGKVKLMVLVRSYDAEHGAPDMLGPDNGAGKIDCDYLADWVSAAFVKQNDSNLVTRVVEELKARTPAYTFLHLANPDITGHSALWGSLAYREAVREVDRQLSRVMAVVETTAAFSQRTAVIVTSDHGGGDSGGAHFIPSELPTYTIPILVWSPGVPSGTDLYTLVANRSDPGTQYLDYDAPRQPLRNGDTANLALTLLGLPSIPGSLMIPELRPSLSAAISPGWLRLSWPVTREPFELEYADGSPAAPWTKILQGITVEGDRILCTMARPDGAKVRFFRLKSASNQ